MLRTLSWEEFLEWRVYERMEPFGDRRADWRIASVCSTVMNAALAQSGVKKLTQPRDFLLEFTEDVKPRAEAPRQTWQEMKMIARTMAAAYNADEDRKKGRRRV